MGLISVTMPPNRGAVMLPLGGTREKPNVLIPLYKMDRSELDNLIHAQCAKHGLSERDAQLMADAAQEQYEYRMKVKEASQELHMRVREQGRYPKLRWGGLRPVRKKS